MVATTSASRLTLSEFLAFYKASKLKLRRHSQISAVRRTRLLPSLRILQDRTLDFRQTGGDLLHFSLVIDRRLGVSIYMCRKPCAVGSLELDGVMERSLDEDLLEPTIDLGLFRATDYACIGQGVGCFLGLGAHDGRGIVASAAVISRASGCEWEGNELTCCGVDVGSDTDFLAVIFSCDLKGFLVDEGHFRLGRGLGPPFYLDFSLFLTPELTSFAQDMVLIGFGMC